MEFKSAAELIESLKCELRETSLFTEDEISSLDMCVPDNSPIVAEDIVDPVLPIPPDVTGCLTDLNTVIDRVKEDMIEANKINTVKMKLTEVMDNINIVAAYYNARYETFNTYATDSTTLLIQRDVLKSQVGSARTVEEKSALQARVDAISQQLLDLQNKSSILSDKKFNALDFLSKDTFLNSLGSNIALYCTNILLADFSPVTTSRAKNNEFSFGIRIPQLRKYKYTDPDNKDQVLDILSYVDNKKIFDSTSMFDIKSYEEIALAPKIKLSKVIDSIRGSLYKNDSGAGYPGLYFNLERPLTRLFTLQERGLTLDPNAADPALKGTAASTVTEEETKYYIHDLDVYTEFYKTLDTTLKARIQAERNVNFPAQSKTAIDAVKEAGNREALYYLRVGGIFEKTITDLKVETVIDQTNTITTDTSKLASSKSKLSTTLDKFKKASEEIALKLSDIQAEIVKLDAKLDTLAVTQQGVMDKISAIPCFAQQPDQGGCDDLKASLGSDPFGVNMTANGASSTYPDITTMCYWKEFAKCATQIGLIPLPGDKLVNIFELRYWPIGLVIPTPAKLIHVPLPHIWIPLFVSSSPLGTIVIFIAQCGIIPSPFVFFLSPSGSKSFILSLKGPQKAMGYDINGNRTMSGDGKSGPTFKPGIRLTNPFSTIPKAFDITFPHTNGDLEAKIDADSNVVTGLLDKSESVESYLNDLRQRAVKQIDSIGDLKMTNIIKARVDSNGNLNKYTLEQKFDMLQKDLAEAVDQLKIGPIKIPKDKGKLMIKRPALLDVADLVQGFAGAGEQLQDKNNFDIKHILSGFTVDVDNTNMVLPKTVISNDPAKIEKNVKDKLRSFNHQVFEMALGTSNKQLSDSDKMYNDVDSLSRAQSSLQGQHDQYMKLLTSTTTTILAGASIQLFNPFKKCCEATKFQLPTVIPPIVGLVLQTSRSMLDSLIDDLSNKEIEFLTNLTSVGLGEIKSFYNSVLMVKFPSMRLPNTIDIFSLSTIMAFVAPVLGAISIPQVPTLLPLFPAQISINLDSVAKGTMNKIFSNHTLLQNFSGIDFIQNFDQISSAELKSILKQVVDRAMTDVQSVLDPVLKPLQLIRSSNGASKTALEAALPIMNLKAEAKAIVRSLMKNSQTIEFVDTQALAELAATGLLSAASKFTGAASFIPVIILGALELFLEARNLHPLYNHDDIPSWERLTVKNPLFALFLDEFCSVATPCTGVILGTRWP